MSEKQAAVEEAVAETPAAINYETLPAKKDEDIMGEGLIDRDKVSVDDESVCGRSDMKLGADRSDEKVYNNNKIALPRSTSLVPNRN